MKRVLNFIDGQFRPPCSGRYLPNVNPATGQVDHVSLRYREHHEWVRTADGWRVLAVRFIGAPERTVLP